MISKQTILDGRGMSFIKGILKPIYPLLFFLFFFNNILLSQENYFENINISPATCGEGNGSIQIDEPPSYIDYIWLDSIESLNRSQLAPGIYTISGEDEEGCIETIVLEVPDISNCAFELTTWYVPQPVPGSSRDGTIYPCIVVGFNFTLNGVDVPYEYLDINWIATAPSPVYPTGYIYTSNEPSVPVYVDGTVVDLEVSLITEHGPIPCCTFTDKIHLRDVCPPITPPKIYVLRSTFRDNTHTSTIPGMVELLVYGDGTCEATTDLRGFIIDDNNGQLIPGQDTTLVNGDSLNIDPGFIKFGNVPNWAAVPNGSIITIFESGHALNTALSSNEDPTDSNLDFHYLLALENPNYFEGSTSQWDFSKQYNTYQGTTVSPSWTLIEANGETDGMQVRYPDGSYCHGFSYGKNSASLEENLFALYLSETPHDYCQIQMNELSYFDKSAFSIQEITGGFIPGQIGSSTMQNIVDQLRDCSQPGPSMIAQETQLLPPLNTVHENNSKQTSFGQNILEVYPNPFQQFLQINFQSSSVGEGSVRIYDGQGRQVDHHKVFCDGQLQHLEVDFSKKLSGLFFIQFQSPEGTIILEKAILLKTD